MDLKKDYREFYKRWVQEIETEKITKFSEEDYLKITDLLKTITDLPLTDKNPVKTRLIEGYRNNISYMLEDFLSVRKMKIVNSAMMMKEIDLNILIDPEKLLYQNLVSAFKGFQKMNSQLQSGISINLRHLQRGTVSNGLESGQNEQIDSEIAADSDIQTSRKIESAISKEPLGYDYTLIRILKDTPELVGFDLKVYGPFQKEDVVNIPEKNAKILVTEKFAERYEVS